MISPTVISAYLSVIEGRTKDRWTWSYVEEKQYWRIKYSGTVPVCEIQAEISGPGLCLQSYLGDFRINPSCRAALYLFLLRLNEDLPVVKFGVGHRGRISLMAEMLATHVDLSALEELLQGVVAVFAQYRREIELLSGEPALAGVVTKGLDVAGDPGVTVTVGLREPASQSTH